MLQNKDHKFIEDSMDHVKKILIRSSGSIDRAEECLSYLTDVYLEYDKEKNPNFPLWAAQRCSMRYKDDQRSMIGPTRYNNFFKSKRLKEVMAKNNKDSEEYVQAQEELSSMNPLDKFYDNCSMDDYKGRFDIADFKNSFEGVEWEDLKQAIFNKLDKYFPESKENKSSTKKNMIYKSLIREYIIPKCEGAKHITLEAIAQRNAVCIATVTNAKNHETLKIFFRNILERED